MEEFRVEILDSGYVYHKVKTVYGNEKTENKAFTTKTELIQFLEKEL